MNGQELATAVQYGLHVVFVVIDNGMYGTIRMHQERAYPGRVYGSDLLNPDFAALARAYGAHGETVNRTEEFGPALERALGAARSALLHVRIDPQAITMNATIAALRAGAAALRAPISAMTFSPPDPVLAVSGLSVEFRTSERVVAAVREVSFGVGRAETVALVGESGSGKSVTALSVLRLVEHGGGRILSGSIDFQRPNGSRIDLARADPASLQAIRGAEIAMIFQEPMTSLNPVYSVGEQIAESIRLHQGKDRAAARAEALRMLEQVRIPEAGQVLARYPHQLSGGMRQRVMIAMALSCKPALLIADEPTTALDVTIQAQILELIRRLQAEMHMAVIFITHDMGVVAEVAERVLVMLRGELIEEGSADAIFHSPRHPYTRALLAAVPRLGSMQGSDLPARFPLPQSGADARRALHRPRRGRRTREPRCSGCAGSRPASTFRAGSSAGSSAASTRSNR